MQGFGSTARFGATEKKPELNLDIAKLLLGKQGEVKIEDIESDKKICMGIFADGIYEKRVTPVGKFVYKKHNILFPYLDKSGEPSFEFTLPKVPFGLLTGVAAFFKDIMDKMHGSEVMVQIYWSFTEEKYFIYVPEQQVAGASIRFQHSEILQNDENVHWVLDIHSHNTMGAFFSGTDSADEKSTRVFGVIGKIKSKDEYDMVLRAGVNGSFIPLEIDYIFDKEDLSAYSIPASDFDKVTRYKFTPTAPSYFGQAGASRNNHYPNAHNQGYRRGLNHIYDYDDKYPRQDHSSKSAKKRNAQSWEDDYYQSLIEDGSWYGDFARGYVEKEDYDYDIPEDDLLIVDLTDEEDFLWGDTIDEDLFNEYRGMRDDLNTLYAARNEGMLDVADYESYFVSIFENLIDFDEFDERQALSMLELCSSVMGSKFSKVISRYNELYGDL